MQIVDSLGHVRLRLEGQETLPLALDATHLTVRNFAKGRKDPREAGLQVLGRDVLVTRLQVLLP